MITAELVNQGQELETYYRELSSQISTLKWHPWVTALIGVFAAALTAYLSTRGSLKGQQKDRQSKGQREAIYGAQDALQALLKSWTKLKDWSALQGDAPIRGIEGDPLPNHKEQHLLAEFSKQVSRIDDEELRTRFNDWAHVARLFFHGHEDTSSRDETELRNMVLRQSGEQARKLDATRSLFG